jgi:hypothetical protein
MKGAAGCNAECPGTSTRCRGAVDESKACGGGDREDGVVGRRSETRARAALSAAGARFSLIVVRRLCFG